MIIFVVHQMSNSSDQLTCTINYFTTTVYILYQYTANYMKITKFSSVLGAFGLKQKRRIFILQMHTIMNNAPTVVCDHIFALFSLTIVFGNFKTSSYKDYCQKSVLRILQRMFRMSHCPILWMMIKTRYITQYQFNLRKEPFHKLSNEVF